MQDTINIEEILEDLRPLIEFSSFFSLPGNEKIEGFFWQDAKGNSVDCNIYQPKYGGITINFCDPKTKKQMNVFQTFAATSFEYSTGYRSNGKNISCKWYLECVCVDGQKFYSKDRIEIFKKPFSAHQQRYASTNEDFELIYQRELKQITYKESGALEITLHRHVLEMLDYEKSLPAKEGKPFADLEIIADKFLKWLNMRTEGILQHDAEENETEKDALVLKIQKHLMPFEELMDDTNYNILIDALKQYFNTGEFPLLKEVIKVKKSNMKRFGWALKELYKSEGHGDFAKYLSFAKHNISLFLSVDFDENNFTKSNLYRYFTQKVN